MQFKRGESRLERRITIGAVVSSQFLSELSRIYKPEFLQGGYAVKVIDWCLKYFRKYNEAPKQEIQNIFLAHKRSGRLPEDEADLIETFLGSISKEFEETDKFNHAYLRDEAVEYFKKRSLTILAEDMQALVSTGDIHEAETALAKYQRVIQDTDTSINPFTDVDRIVSAFEEDAQPLFRLPGAVGKFLGAFERDMFVAFMGPEKIGKSQWLMETAIQAYRQRCNVAFFQAGDMSEPQMLRRIHSRMTRRPFKEKSAGKRRVPVLDCMFNQDDSCSRRFRTSRVGVLQEGGEIYPFDAPEVAKYVPCTFCQKEDPWAWKGAVWYKEVEREVLEWKDAVQYSNKLHQWCPGKTFKLATFANDTLSVQGIRDQLDVWEQTEGVTFDVIIIDYADILAPEDRREDSRARENTRWKALRALSQQRHCCVITATQADAKSYKKKSLTEDNFSEDKRKYSHVNMIITLNRVSEEKEAGVMRVGKMFVREDEYLTEEHCTVLQDLSISSPLLGSFMGGNVWDSKKSNGGGDGNGSGEYNNVRRRKRQSNDD